MSVWASMARIAQSQHAPIELVTYVAMDLSPPVP